MIRPEFVNKIRPIFIFNLKFVIFYKKYFIISRYDRVKYRCGGKVYIRQNIQK